ncbi:MAG: glycoside hydrolase family 3 N-terminal domain-containing protein [Ignavibacteriaceae bacterium]
MSVFLLLSILTEADIYTNDSLFAEETMDETSLLPDTQNLFELTINDIEEIENQLDELTLYEKCAQMVVPAVYRGFLNPKSKEYKKIVELVRDHGIGGIVLFQGNAKEQSDMIKHLQKNAKVPLLISGDYENGLGMRMDDAIKFPHNMALGATNNSEFAYQVGRTTAIEGKKLGINFNLAPVADINDNPLNPIINIRAYSQDKKTVSAFVRAFIKGSDESRVLTSVKHFPGHGNTITDSHEDLPKINGSKQYLFENELYPFIEAINSGVKSIMIGHLEVPSLENEMKIPASLSYNIITKLLREELGFDGLIISDAFDMLGVTKYFSQEEIAVKSVLAGNDIILAPLKPLDAINYIYSAVNDGKISEERIEFSVRKILAAKKWIASGYTSFSISNSEIQNEQQLLAQKIADESITLIKNNEDIFPVRLNEYNTITNIAISDGAGGLITEYFGDLLKAKRYDISSIKLTRKSTKRDYENAKSSALKSDVVIISSYILVSTNPENEEIETIQQEFIQSLIDINRKVIFISFNNPYLLSKFPEVKTYINTYSNSQYSQQAALKTLVGDIEFRGKLPVTIPGTGFNIGYGIMTKLSIN